MTVAETPANIELLIVDNDVNESARQVCEAAQSPWSVRYFVQPRRGISQARNTAVRHSAGADWIAFVDDDETVSPQWLNHLLRAQRRFQADIVGGRVVVQYRSGVPKWIIQSRFFERGRYATGSRPKALATCNVLISAEVFRRIGSFDERFGLSGGEDSQFFLRADKAGFKIVWCDEAVTHEPLGHSRVCLTYLLRRQYQDANSMARSEMTCNPGFLACARRATKAVVRIAQGILMLPVAFLLGLPETARALLRICLGAGILSGMVGITVEPYRNPETEL